MQKVRHDPAPSRLSYRITRIWLTPLYRRLIRQGIPLFLLVFTLTWWIGNSDRRAVLAGHFETLRLAVAERPEFAVTMMEIEGGNPAVDRAVRALLPHELPASSLDIDLAAFKGAIEGVEAVESAQLRVTPARVMQVRLRLRQPALAWYRPSGVVLLDAQGHPVLPFEGAVPPGLIRVAGLGADQATDEAQAIWQEAGYLTNQIKGLMRIGERRWDVVLNSDQRILLPEQGAATALAHFVSLNAQSPILARDITHVDMRLLERITLRLAQHDEEPPDAG